MMDELNLEEICHAAQRHIVKRQADMTDKCQAIGGKAGRQAGRQTLLKW
jgi:hypothetical protein